MISGHAGGLVRDFDPAHPTWREYLAGLQDTPDSQGWTYHFYVTRPQAWAVPTGIAAFGCFSYARLSDDRIRLHFRNAKRMGTPLSVSPVEGGDGRSWSRIWRTAQVIGRRFQHMPLWGQFLDREGQVKENMTRQFLERLECQSSVESLDQCFPLPVLSVQASVREFYDFYGT